jgi:hypothetical protein
MSTAEETKDVTMGEAAPPAEAAAAAVEVSLIYREGYTSIGNAQRPPHAQRGTRNYLLHATIPLTCHFHVFFLNNTQPKKKKVLPPPRFEVKKWNAVAMWSWDIW